MNVAKWSSGKIEMKLSRRVRSGTDRSRGHGRGRSRHHSCGLDTQTLAHRRQLLGRKSGQLLFVQVTVRTRRFPGHQGRDGNRGSGIGGNRRGRCSRRGGHCRSLDGRGRRGGNRGFRRSLAECLRRSDGNGFDAIRSRKTRARHDQVAATELDSLRGDFRKALVWNPIMAGKVIKRSLAARLLLVVIITSSSCESGRNKTEKDRH